MDSHQPEHSGCLRCSCAHLIGDSDKARLLVPCAPYEPTDEIISPSPRPVPRRRRICLRVLHAVVIAFVVFLFVPKLVHKAARNFGRIHGTFGMVDHVDDCVQRADWIIDDNQDPNPHYPFSYNAHTSFSLPVASELLYLVGKGVLTHGRLEITDDGETDSDVAKVDISVLFHSPHALDNVQACLLKHGQDKTGVGIFTPEHWPHPPQEHHMNFVVTVHLPPKSDGTRLEINRFETDMHLFSHSLDDLENTVAFRSISLQTANAPISVKSLSAGIAGLKTSNSEINGSFNSSSHLELITSNGAIKATVGLTHSGSGKATKLFMKSSNSILSSSVSLLSASSDGTGGVFDVTAYTSNGPLEVTYPDAAVDSVLRFDGRTSNSPGRVLLHKTYEGEFFLRSSSWFSPSVEYDRETEDPAGKDRVRSVETRTIGRGVVRGAARWLPGEREQQGSVKLQTSNSPLHLVL